MQYVLSPALMRQFDIGRLSFQVRWIITWRSVTRYGWRQASFDASSLRHSSHPSSYSVINELGQLIQMDVFKLVGSEGERVVTRRHPVFTPAVYQ